MRLNPQFKLVYEKKEDSERKLYASEDTTPTTGDEALEPNLDALDGIKLVYQRDGKIWGSKESVPTAEDTSAVVKVGGVDLFITDATSASSLAAAIAAGGSVVLSDNIADVTTAIDITGDTTLNLNGKTISGVNSNLSRPGFLSVFEGSLTIKGAGKIKVNSYVLDIGSVNNQKEANAVIEDGYFESDSASVVQLEKGSLTIKGGTFKTNYSDPKYTINRVDRGDGTITISGGKFYKFNPSTNPEITIEDGYEVKEGGDWFEVVKSAED